MTREKIKGPIPLKDRPSCSISYGVHGASAGFPLRRLESAHLTSLGMIRVLGIRPSPSAATYSTVLLPPFLRLA
jgi:hypothetical protein